MANKKNTKDAAKAATKKPVSKKKAQTPPPAPAAEEAPVQTVESPAPNMSQFTTQNAVGSTASRLSADSRVTLLNLADDIFRKDPNATQRFGLQVCESINQIVAAGVVSALADEAAFSDGTFATVLKSSMYPQLVVAAQDMGIKLPTIKALPSGEEEGTVVIESGQVKVSKETKTKLKEEREIIEKGDSGEIELDPKKVAELGEEELVKALTYHIASKGKTSRNTKDMLTGVVDFMREYRMALANKADNTVEAMEKYDNRTMREWLQDIFQYVEPTVLMSGIGRGMKTLIMRDKSPISAFIILRNSLIDKESGAVVWDDQSIADAVFAIVELMCNKEIAAEQKAIEALDSKAEGYKEIVEKHNKVIADNETILGYINDISYDICERYNTPEGDKDENLQKVYGQLMKMYHPMCDCRGGHFVNLNENLRQRAGIILNLFRSPSVANKNYNEVNILDVFVKFPGSDTEYTLTEWFELEEKERKEMVDKAAKEEATAAKKSSAKK